MKFRKIPWMATITLLIGLSFCFAKFNNCSILNDNNSNGKNENKGRQIVKAANFELENINGKKLKLKDYQGKVVMLNFWATWCPPCRRELPDIAKLRENFKNKDFEVIGIITERADGNVLENVKHLKKKFKIKYPLVWYDENELKNYGQISSIPRTIILDKNGNIVSDFVGGRSYSFFNKLVSKILK